MEYWLSAPRSAAFMQGLTLVHYSAQLEPFLLQKHTLNTPNTPLPPPKQSLTAPPVTQKALKLS